MADISDEDKKLFRSVNKIEPDFFLAHYESRPNFHTYLYEKDDKPFAFIFDENALVKPPPVEISSSLPDKMKEWMSLKQDKADLGSVDLKVDVKEKHLI